MLCVVYVMRSIQVLIYLHPTEHPTQKQHSVTTRNDTPTNDNKKQQNSASVSRDLDSGSVRPGFGSSSSVVFSAGASGIVYNIV